MIEFDYEVIQSDLQAKCMEVIYSAEGKTPIHVGVPLPRQGQNLESVLRQFAPIAQWEQDGVAVTPIEVGVSGSLSSTQVETPLTHAEMVERTKAAARTLRMPILSILDGMQASCLANDDRQAALMVEGVKTALKNITSTDLSWCTSEQEMQMAIFAAYIQIRNAAPAFVQSAFAQLAEL